MIANHWIYIAGLALGATVAGLVLGIVELVYRWRKK